MSGGQSIGASASVLKMNMPINMHIKYIYIYTHIITIVNYSAISSLLLICFRLKIIYKYTCWFINVNVN